MEMEVPHSIWGWVFGVVEEGEKKNEIANGPLRPRTGRLRGLLT